MLVARYLRVTICMRVGCDVVLHVKVQVAGPTFPNDLVEVAARRLGALKARGPHLLTGLIAAQGAELPCASQAVRYGGKLYRRWQLNMSTQAAPNGCLAAGTPTVHSFAVQLASSEGFMCIRSVAQCTNQAPTTRLGTE
jgi:hypothetical protein